MELSDEELTRLTSYYTLQRFKKNEYLLREGQVCDFEAYVLVGCFRIYYEDENLREHILYFAVEDWWVLDIGSFISGTPSRLNIQALEDSEVLRIDRPQKERLYREMPQLEQLFRIMNQKALAALQMRMISMLSKKAGQRLEDFTEKYPTLSQRIAQHHIASYLGISHEFLSKVRKNILRKKK
ncbi:Crp/Fnr family transcriptional regulator [Chitinophaga barathri]|uniref:Crp/Fnr family transcriptional regulator n=1 Tax=Chitinophaga barathri TaxID=1647451 RepID=UPI0019D46F18|nr:Crp/Fnr family transcriptional regulator [Chitinophaga barathri]